MKKQKQGKSVGFIGLGNSAIKNIALKSLEENMNKPPRIVGYDEAISYSDTLHEGIKQIIKSEDSSRKIGVSSVQLKV